MYFRNYRLWKISTAHPVNGALFGTRFETQHVKVSHILAKSPWQHFHHVFLSFWEKLIWKMSPRLFLEILGVFLNTLTADAKYPFEDWDILQFPMHMQLCQKQKIFSQFIIPFLESTSNFKHLEKKHDGHS